MFVKIKKAWSWKKIENFENFERCKKKKKSLPVRNGNYFRFCGIRINGRIASQTTAVYRISLFILLYCPAILCEAVWIIRLNPFFSAWQFRQPDALYIPAAAGRQISPVYALICRNRHKKTISRGTRYRGLLSLAGQPDRLSVPCNFGKRSIIS